MDSQIVYTLYFTLTTLSTVGYGDYLPVSDAEKLLCVAMMLGGVALFSYIMGDFIDLAANYNHTFGSPDKGDELAMWLVGLQRYKR